MAFLFYHKETKTPPLAKLVHLNQMLPNNFFSFMVIVFSCTNNNVYSLISKVVKSKHL